MIVQISIFVWCVMVKRLAAEEMQQLQALITFCVIRD